ncbi:MAG: hypothetical protein DWQ01_04255 [Planctomycetota bacterium]|nr:MAG: hypothetical protein DWQ01_04255 [Planctomycetota bacterium]
MFPKSTFSAKVLGLLALSFVPGCFGGGGSLSNKEAQTAGNFQLLSVNVDEGATWELNRAFHLYFNHPVDPTSINFSSIQFKPLDPEILGRPVTGSFSVLPGSNGQTVVFRPACPTNEDNDNGGLYPGGFWYEITLPTTDQFGATVLRDTSGHALSKGTSVKFRTPIYPAETLFLDTRPTAPEIVSVDYPTGLNFFSTPDGTVEIQFDQAIDGRSLNLNNTNLYILFSSDTAANIGPNPQPSDFPETNRLPGELLLVENCTETGATVYFQVAGLLPPDRYLRLVMQNTFRDIVGQTNLARVEWPDYVTPTLADLYNDPSWSAGDETVDEFRDSFDNTQWIDPDAELPLPQATMSDGAMTASFDFPGQFVSPESDLYFADSYAEIFTDGQTIFSDTNNRTFVVSNGVLYCDDFTIDNNSTLRGRGRNPLIIYATGTVTINGELDVSGNNSHWPTSLNSPQFPEGGAIGECGGGDGGTSSQEGLKETLRAESGVGAFGVGTGGQGGEGGFQQSNGHSGSYLLQGMRLAAGGGGGGTFAKTPPEAIVWTKWVGEENPDGFENAGPDHDPVRHPFYLPEDIPGGEAGLRGSSFESANFVPPGTGQNQQGVFGMEDQSVDTVANDGSNTGNPTAQLDPPCDAPGCPDWEPGHPTDGPDGGAAGPSIFSADGTTENDFWGRRFDPSSGEFTIGELLTPWAGSGGGGSGDTQRITRLDLDGIGGVDPLVNFFPDRPFLTNTAWYYKGAPGGAGGGQLLIMAIGKIKFGNNAEVKSKGGIGHGGESIIYTYHQTSGSGGGSGGHVVIHSATEIDLSPIFLDLPSNPSVQELLELIQDRPEDHKDMFQAFGGRRGWCLSDGTRSNNNKDGNPDLMIGRGGAGGNGVIQFHVPSPEDNIKFHNNYKNTIASFIQPGGGPLNLDRLEAVMGLYCSPEPYVLVPFFSAGSQFQSKWIDTGLAYLRLDPDNLNDNYPDFADAGMVMFDGIDTGTGLVGTTQQRMTKLAPLVSADLSQASFAGFELSIPSASALFPASFLRHPELLLGYDIFPDEDQLTGFEIVEASYSRTSDLMVLQSSAIDGAMVTNPGNPTWAIRPKFMRVNTSGIKDGLPNTSSIQVEFQGADESFPGSNEPGTILPGTYSWTSDLSQLQGKRFIRYRLSFDIDANRSGLTLNSPRPVLDYFKLPFVW